MKRMHHLMELISDIKKTDEMISLHKNDEFQLIIDQYEAVKAKQMAEFIDELAKPPFQSAESFSVIKLMIDKFYPSLSQDSVELKELAKLAAAIN
jgi:hypothetical protein